MSACPCYKGDSGHVTTANLYPSSKILNRSKFTLFCAYMHIYLSRTKLKEETIKPLTVNVILPLALAHPDLLFQAPDDSHNRDSDLWL